MGKLRSCAFWKFRSYSSTANFPRETSDLTLPGNLDLIPFWQNLNFSQEFSPGNLRSDAFRDNQPCSVLFQRWSKFVTFWSEIVKKVLINTTFALFSVHFTQNPIFQPFYYSTGHVRPRSTRKRRVRQFEFLTGISPEWFFHSLYTPKEHVFRDPNTFSNLHEAFSSVSQFVLTQHWTALKQRWSALVFLTDSETALKFIKSLKQRCSALICSGTSTRDTILHGSYSEFVTFPQISRNHFFSRISIFFLKNSFSVSIREILLRHSPSAGK